MDKEFWTVSEVIDIFQIDEETITYLEDVEIVCPECFNEQPDKRFSAFDLDKLRLVKLLMEDMDVNLPGVEVILRMRDNMIQMRQQFDDILEYLAANVKEALK